MNSSKICYIDLDGVLTDYPISWLEYIHYERGGYWYKTVEEAKRELSFEEYSRYKADYRGSDYKYQLPVKEGAGKFLMELSDLHWFIVIGTTRPITFPRLVVRTIDWLRKEELVYDDVVFLEKGWDIVTKYPNFRFGVNDEPEVCNQLIKWGYVMFRPSNSSFEDIIGEVAPWT